uniref:Serum amyloid A-like 1 n=1 Tax=Callorhinchus milii TaxID=7868 RepID=A0A4W3IE06_CALMI|eukprot:gi/632940924/ref/XP_007885592.1/ PREDICTED: protein SAAL1 [Callorhinchus milii]
MDRNPSPPPGGSEWEEEVVRGDAIGDTVYSRHWLFSTLLRLIQLVTPKGDDSDSVETELDEEVESEICKVWDMSMDEDVAVFLQEFNATDILLGVIGKSKCPRLTEICVGILGNMACYKETCRSITSNENLVEVLILLLGDTDPPTLLETSRLILTCLSQPDMARTWAEQIDKERSVQENVCFIMRSSTNSDLLVKVGEVVDKLFDLDKELMLSWVAGCKPQPEASGLEQEEGSELELIPCLLEAARQLRSDSTEGLEVYMHILQLLTTVDEGIQAIVQSPDRGKETWALLYEVVRADLCQADEPAITIEEQAGLLAPTLAVLSALFASHLEADYIKAEEHRILLTILLRVLLYMEECRKKPREGVRKASVDQWSVPQPQPGAPRPKRREGDVHLTILQEVCCDFLSELFMEVSKETVCQGFKDGNLSLESCSRALRHLLPLHHTQVKRFHQLLTEVEPDCAERLLLEFPSLKS